MTLTRRETQAVWLLDARLSNAEIAAVLRISPETVKRHMRSICQKLTIHTRCEAVARPHGRWLLLPRAPVGDSPGESPP